MENVFRCRFKLVLIDLSSAHPETIFYTAYKPPPPTPIYKPTQTPLPTCIGPVLITGILRYIKLAGLIFFHVIAKLILADFIVFDRRAGIPRGGGGTPHSGVYGKASPESESGRNGG